MNILIVEMNESLTWTRLCAFLELPTPTYPFPQTNRSGDRDAGFARRVGRRLRREAEERFGRGDDASRTMALYIGCDEQTRRCRDLVSRGGDISDGDHLAVRTLVRTLKTALEIGYDPHGSGVVGTDSAAEWARTEFEVRHAIGQISMFTVDRQAGDDTIEHVAQELIETLRSIR